MRTNETDKNTEMKTEKVAVTSRLVTKESNRRVDKRKKRTG